MTNTTDDNLAAYAIAMKHHRQLMAASGDEEFEDAFTTLMETCFRQLEAHADKYCNLDEETISSILAGFLSRDGIQVSCETHSKGHVDLTIELGIWHPKMTRLGEAKIYKGPKKHIKGLEQLLNRYSSGRDTRAFMVTYVQKPKISVRITSIRSKMNSEQPCNQQGPTEDHSCKWAFRSTHQHSSHECMHIDHYACNLHHDPHQTGANS